MKHRWADAEEMRRKSSKQNKVGSKPSCGANVILCLSENPPVNSLIVCASLVRLVTLNLASYSLSRSRGAFGLPNEMLSTEQETNGEMSPCVHPLAGEPVWADSPQNSGSNVNCFAVSELIAILSFPCARLRRNTKNQPRIVRTTIATAPAAIIGISFFTERRSFLS